MTIRPSGCGVLGFLLTVGCGTNQPEIPPELLVGSGTQPSGYPGGPYGTERGDTVENLAFTGWRNPVAADHAPAALETIAFADFHQPDDPSGPELLLLNTTAVWCQSCRLEHADLPDRHREFGPRGLVILALLYQDGDEQPATTSDLAVWTRQFETPFPMALDPDFLMGRFVPADVAPLNLLVDARTMTIRETFIGDQAAVIWPTVERELASRGR